MCVMSLSFYERCIVRLCRNTNAGQASNASAPPQWGSAPPANLDRHTASEAYQQQYFGSAVPSQPTRSAVPVHDPADLHGYDVEGHTAQSEHDSQCLPVAAN